ncbi:MAG: FkbM family methyltransferase [Saprospiraceae bacterium]|nr:FkbM family methyltransferase [Saprospiraceae bacterium]
MKAAIFFKAYEGAEIRFLRQYLRNTFDVIELGASLGIVSSQIANKLKNSKKRIICVEPNRMLLESLKKNLTSNGGADNHIILNNLVDYSKPLHSEVAFFASSDILGSSKSAAPSSNTFEEYPVKNITLSHILSEFQIDKFSLVCDIEGAEIEMIFNDQAALSKCQQLIIETHNATASNKEYKYTEVIQLIAEKTGMTLVDVYGPVAYFERR